MQILKSPSIKHNNVHHLNKPDAVRASDGGGALYPHESPESYQIDINFNLEGLITTYLDNNNTVRVQ